jgi:SRSO17 transposase
MAICKSLARQDPLRSLKQNLAFHIEEYHHHFQTATSANPELSEAYIRGLFKTEASWRNMERMNEELEMSGDGYQRLQQFISDAPWSASALISDLAVKTSEFYASQPTYQRRDVGYILDESAHLKKGKQSVGVARQYAGVIGKVENCQVGVYASLVWNTHSTLINARLFLPETWTDDPARCDKVGIPTDQRTFKTKLERAREMVQADLEAGVEFDWVGGDGLYGHGLELGQALDEMGLSFLLDVHCDQQIYPFKPQLQVPERTSTRGAAPTKRRADVEALRVDAYAQQLLPCQWQSVTVRDGTKGPLKLEMHVRRVWLWDGEAETPTQRTLVISRRLTDNALKYSLSNDDAITTPIERFAYRQAQRYWVERAFQEAKSELGMSDYQVRKWTAWHHHMALVMLSLSFLVKERIQQSASCPLLSARDIRLLIIAMLLNDPDAVDRRIAQMDIRHEQRRKDIERYDRENDPDSANDTG